MSDLSLDDKVQEIIDNGSEVIMVVPKQYIIGMGYSTLSSAIIIIKTKAVTEIKTNT